MQSKKDTPESLIVRKPIMDLADPNPVGKNITKKEKPKFKKKINKNIMWKIIGICAGGAVMAAIVCGFVC